VYHVKQTAVQSLSKHNVAYNSNGKRRQMVRVTIYSN